MDNLVFIFGAGASKPAGAPLMADFLDVAERLNRRVRLPEQDQFELVFRAIAELQTIHSKAAINLANIESVFAAFEMAVLFERPLGGLSVDDVRKLPSAMRAVISRTLDSTVTLSYRVKAGGEGNFVPHPGTGHIVSVLSSRLPKHEEPRNGPTLLTFNYDIALDFALHYYSFDPILGLDGLDDRRRTALLKLHGSLNWARCSKCQEVIAVPMSELVLNAKPRGVPEHGSREQPLHILDTIKTRKHCGVPMEVMIVPPTWNKAGHYDQIKPVWQLAAERLAQAEQIYVIGYSLPDSDYFFQYLYALGTVGMSRIKRFCVINIDKTAESRDRFARALGPMAASRFEYRVMGIEHANQLIAQDDWG